VRIINRDPVASLIKVTLTKMNYIFELRSLLQDFYHDPSIISIDGELLSLACIYIALQVYGIQLSNEPDLSWMEVSHVFQALELSDKI
jgi:hypothetical protein